MVGGTCPVGHCPFSDTMFRVLLLPLDAGLLDIQLYVLACSQCKTLVPH